MEEHQVATISFPEGTTFRQQYTLQDQSRIAIDLNGATLTFAVYHSTDPVTGHVTPIIQKTIGLGIVLIDATNGVFRIEFTPAETIDKAGSYDWELNLVEASGDTWLAGTGKLIIFPARRLDNP